MVILKTSFINSLSIFSKLSFVPTMLPSKADADYAKLKAAE